MRKFLGTVLPYLPEFGWYRRLIGGHWECRVHFGPVVPGGPNERQAHWGHTDECWRDVELFNGKFGVKIEACENYGDEAKKADSWVEQ